MSYVVRREKGEIEKRESRREKNGRGSEEEMHNTLYSYVKFNPHTNAHQINSHTVMLLNLLSGLLAAVTPTVTG